MLTRRVSRIGQTLEWITGTMRVLVHPLPFVGEGGRRPGEGSRTNGERLLWRMRSLAYTRPSQFSSEAEAE